MQTPPRRALPYPPLRQEILFGGEKGWANAPAQARPAPSVNDAKKLAESGAKEAEIFQETGWYRGPDGQWKWILSDQGASLNPDAFELATDPAGIRSMKAYGRKVSENIKLKGEDSRKLPEVLNHPALYETYPKLKDATVIHLSSQEGAGALADYDSSTNTVRIAGNRSQKEILSTLLHELQHGVQNIEGFSRGSSFTENLPADVQLGKRPPTREEEKQAFEAYSVVSGETEARQAQKQFETQNWSQLPTQMKGFPAPDMQLNRFGQNVSLGKGYQFIPVDHDPFRVPVDYDPYAMKPVDHDPFAPATNAYEQAMHDYPILRDQGIVGGPGNASQRLEFWPPNEPGAPGKPRPDFIPMDKPGVELGQGDVRSLDVLGDVVSHHMVEKDPVVKRYYERFTESLTPDQKQRLQEQYEHARINENEARPYEQWEEKSGLPAYFRGYPFQQWPAEVNEQAYTPEQRDHLDRMMNYLQGPQQSPTPY